MSTTRPSTRPRLRRRDGMTLIEIVAVMTIMTLLLTLGIGAYLSWGRLTALDTAESRLLSSLGLARQWAISHRTPTTLVTTNLADGGVYAILADEILVGGPTNRLPHRLRFVPDTDGTPSVTFRPDGSCAGTDDDWEGLMTRDIVFEELADSPEATPMQRRIEVHRLTGHARGVDS